MDSDKLACVMYILYVDHRISWGNKKKHTKSEEGHLSGLEAFQKV